MSNAIVAPRFSIRRRIIACLTVGAMALSACQTTGGGYVDEADMTPAQKQMRDQSSKFNETVVEGAAVGTALGGIIGALVGQSLLATVIGAAAGLAAGTTAGYFVASQQEQYANKEEQLDGLIAVATEQNGEMTKLAALTEEVIAEHKKKIGDLKQQLASGSITKKQADDQLAAAIRLAKADATFMRQNEAKTKKRSDALTGNVELYVKENPDADVSGLRTQTKRFAAAQTRQEALLRDFDVFVAANDITSD